MKVLHVLGCMNKGGTENFVINHSLKLKEDFEFIFMTINSQPQAYIDVLNENKWRVYVAPKWSIRNFFVMYNFIKEVNNNEHIDIIHCHLNCDNYFLILIAYLLKIKIRISHSHDTAGISKKGIKKLFCNFKVYIINHYSTKLLACSIESGRYLYGEKFDVCGHVINNGIDLDNFLHISQVEINAIKDKYNLKGKK